MNRFKENTIVGIVTCNRQEMFQTCFDSIDKEAVDKIVVINSGDRYDSYPDNVEVIFPKRAPIVVGVAKNMLLREMYNAVNSKGEPYEWFFVVEDDVKITDNKVWEKYIETACDSGLIHFQLSYGTHGGIAGGSVNPDGSINKAHVVEYSKNQVDFYNNSFAAFSVGHRSTLQQFGGGNLFREDFINAAEHLYSHHLMFTRGMGTPFHYFADVFNSFQYIQDQDENHNKSSIRNNPDFMKNFLYSWQLFKSLVGKTPDKLEKMTPVSLMGCLENLEALYAKKQLL